MSEKNVKQLRKAILALSTEDECDRFLKDLCTLKEVDDLSTRLEVARLLAAGVNYIDIAEATGASTATISRVSKCLAGEVGGYRTVLERLVRERREYEKISPFTIAVSSDRASLSAYERLAEILPFLPRNPFAASQKSKVRVFVASAADVAMLLLSRSVELAISSSVDLEECGGSLEPIYDFGISESFGLVGEPVAGGKIATPYPKVTERFLSGRLGFSAVYVRFLDPSLALSVGGYCAAVTQGERGALFDRRICLYPAENADAKLLETLADAFS